MRSKKPFIVASFLCGWTIITYLLWMRQMVDVDINHKHMLKKLNYLEGSIKEETDIHDELVQKLVNSIKLRNQQQLLSKQSTSTSDNNIGLDTNKIGAVQNNINHNNVNIIDGIERVKEIPLDNHNNLLKPNLNSILLNAKQHADTFKGPVIPILVFACNRISVSKCLDNLVQYRPNQYQFPIIVSQVSLNIYIHYIHLTILNFLLLYLIFLFLYVTS